MRFFSAIAAALPALSAAQDFQQYQAQFQNFLGQLGSYIPNPAAHNPAAAMEAKVGSMKLHVLTLDNWRDTLYEPVSPGATKPEEWWVLTSGRNKTCFGHCGRIETAYNETAARFALLPSAPHMGLINCDDQPILCNSWSAGAGTLWIFDMLPQPAPIDIYKKRFNMTTVTADDIAAVKDDRSSTNIVDSWFHPFNGKATELGLAVPFGYLTWFFNVVPSWMFMLGVSFISRSMMSRRMEGHGR